MQELQQRITSAEFVEYMASYSVDQRGGHYDDLRAGTIASVLANVNRDSKRRRQPYGIFDFLPWSEHHRAEADEPVHLADPQAQSELILRSIFGKKND